MSSAEQNKAIVEKAYREVAAGNWDGFYEHFHPEVVLIEAESLPYGGTYYGVKGARRAIDAAIAAWDKHDFQVEEIAASGNLVFVYLYMIGVGRQTGKTFSMPLTEVWRFRDGKVVEFRPFYFDTARARECFG